MLGPPVKGSGFI